jgi:methyl-accepting chemotaxis protein
LAVTVQIDTTLHRSEILVSHGFQRFAPSFNRTAVIQDLEQQLEQAREREGDLAARLANLEAEHAGAAEAAAASAGRVAFFEGLTAHLHQFGESTKAVQSSLAMLAAAMKTETQEAVKASGETAQSQQVVRKLTEHISHLTDRTQASSGAIDQLHAETGKINGIVQLIKEIADQTNLLALNAAIEAAPRRPPKFLQ